MVPQKLLCHSHLDTIVVTLCCVIFISMLVSRLPLLQVEFNYICLGALFFLGGGGTFHTFLYKVLGTR